MCIFISALLFDENLVPPKEDNPLGDLINSIIDLIPGYKEIMGLLPGYNF